MAKCITGSWKSAKYSPWLDLVAILTGKLNISEEAANELKWWIRNIFGAFAPIKLLPFDLTIFSDASLEGWRGTDQVTEIGRRWNCIETKCHINSLQLQAALFPLESFLQKY